MSFDSGSWQTAEDKIAERTIAKPMRRISPSVPQLLVGKAGQASTVSSPPGVYVILRVNKLHTRECRATAV